MFVKLVNEGFIDFWRTLPVCHQCSTYDISHAGLTALGVVALGIFSLIELVQNDTSRLFLICICSSFNLKNECFFKDRDQKLREEKSENRLQINPPYSTHLLIHSFNKPTELQVVC